MAVHTITKGLDIPITGDPEHRIEAAWQTPRVALMASDYVGMRPTMFVREGDAVKRGQPLFEDKKNPGVIYTSPGAGTVAAVNRGARRALQSVVIELTESERAGEPGGDELQAFEAFIDKAPADYSADEARALLVESGLWTALRTRPFSKVPPIDGEPHSLFVTAMDTNPLAPPVDVVMQGKEQDFEAGLRVAAKLTQGPTYLCKRPGHDMPGQDVEGVQAEEFDGPHPAGNVGLHIHMLDPVPFGKVVWHINYQDVIAIGRLFQTGRLDVRQVIALAGPQVREPRLLDTRQGVHIDALASGELKEGENRVISGSVLSGRSAMGEVFGYLGRYHHQVSVVREGREREFLGWMAPGGDKFSVLSVFLSKLTPDKKFDFTTSTHGGERAMVPIGLYEKVMPMDILPTFLLRALVIGDIERAERLGCLELDEEDLALCTFVCPGKCEYGPYLRNVLTTIEKEG